MYMYNNLKDLLNAVRRPLTQYTVLNCVSHFNSVVAKRAVAEKTMFILLAWGLCQVWPSRLIEIMT